MKELKEQLILFNTAVLAKEKGFDLEIQGMYVGAEYEVYNEPLKEPSYNWNDRKGYSAPTQSLLQDWLRELHNLEVVIKPVGNLGNIKSYAVALMRFSFTSSDTFVDLIVELGK